MYEIIFRNYKTNEEKICFGRNINAVREQYNLDGDWYLEHYDYID